MYDYADELTETTVAEVSEGDQLILSDIGEPEVFVDIAQRLIDLDLATLDYVSEVHDDGGWLAIQTADGREFPRPPGAPIVVRRALKPEVAR